jgi:hypothetical protein
MSRVVEREEVQQLDFELVYKYLLELLSFASDPNYFLQLNLQSQYSIMVFDLNLIYFVGKG